MKSDTASESAATSPPFVTSCSPEDAGRSRATRRRGRRREIMSRISVVSSAAPAMRDFSTRLRTSSRPENSKRPPTRRNSRIFAGQFLLLINPSGDRWKEQSCDPLPGPRAKTRSRAAIRAERRTPAHARSCEMSGCRHRISCTGAEAGAGRRRGNGNEERKPGQRLAGRSDLRLGDGAAHAAAFSLAAGSRARTAPPSGLFWQVICPL